MSATYVRKDVDRRRARRCANLSAACDALLAMKLAGVRQLGCGAAADGHWVITALMDTCAKVPPTLDGKGYTILFSRAVTPWMHLERRRIGRFFKWVRRRGVTLNRIVSGTSHGPDIILRLKDKSAAVVEIKGVHGSSHVRLDTQRTYAHLFATFKVFLAVENHNQNWHLFRVRPNSFKPAEWEELDGD